MHNNVLNYLNNIVGKCPDKIAYSDGQISLTFREVYDNARSIGSHLYSMGVYKKPVVIYMNKSPREIAAFFGVVYSGCYYVPIDEEMPADRIELILDNVKSPVIICDNDTLEAAKKLQQPGQSILLFDDAVMTVPDESALDHISRKAIDTDPIYIVFTSGSTGIPKGVVACHRSVIDYIEQLSEVLEFDENTVFGNQSPLYFDACLKEVYPTIKFGATDYLIPKRLFSFPVKLIEYLNEHRINTICWVASALAIVSSFKTFDEITPEYLRTVAFGSEVFPIPQFNKWKETLPNVRFINLYGPTECTGMSCYYRVDRKFDESETIPIGRPFDNTEIILLNEEGMVVPPGDDGEICIRGTAVTLGYYNDRDRTDAVFVQNPLNPYYPEIIYKTGDIGRYDSDGELIYVSRKDFQIKHMGHRIELGEIEANVNSIDGIKLSACVYDKTSDVIALYYVGDVAEKDMERMLKDKLPRYMLPRKTFCLDNIPFTGNGKIDRVTLLKMFQNT